MVALCNVCARNYSLCLAFSGANIESDCEIGLLCFNDHTHSLAHLFQHKTETMLEGQQGYRQALIAAVRPQQKVNIITNSQYDLRRVYGD